MSAARFRRGVDLAPVVPLAPPPATLTAYQLAHAIHRSLRVHLERLHDDAPWSVWVALADEQADHAAVWIAADTVGPALLVAYPRAGATFGDERHRLLDVWGDRCRVELVDSVVAAFETLARWGLLLDGAPIAPPTGRHLAILEALDEGETYEAAAERAGCSRSTVDRLIRNHPLFGRFARRSRTKTRDSIIREALADGESVTRAAELAGCSRSTAVRLIRRDPTFAAFRKGRAA